MAIIKLPANYYQQFDADFNRDIPGEGYGGWKKSEIEINTLSTAFVVMHAWDCGTREQYPGWHRVVEYIPRSYDICRNVFPTLLEAIRKSGLKLYHVGTGGDYLNNYPGYASTLKLVEGQQLVQERAQSDPALEKLWQFKSEHAFPGNHNKADIKEGQKHLDFPEQAKPFTNEDIAITSEQLFALCKRDNINHLIYSGFAINGCLLTSPGGMLDMLRKGVMCSAIRQAVTAIENKETARNELAKQLGLWFVSIISGFVFDADDIIKMTGKL
jgi:nicotinamidase-related amidase